MKFRVTMKDPDVLHDSMKDAVDEFLEAKGHDAEEREALASVHYKRISDLCDTWFEYDEYLTVEIDTDAKTCVVVPRK